jgi:hypothetical protein
MGEGLNIDDVVSWAIWRFRNWAADLGGPKAVRREEEQAF